MTKRTKLNKSDLKIYPSERLTDNDDGGGLALGTPLTGADNELFDPISSIQRINGGMMTRLVYAGVQRADDEPLLGAYTAITKPPKDPSVSYLLTRAGKFGEVRGEMVKAVEAYSVATIESRMTLMSTQSKNSRIVQAYQSVGEPLPLVGDVYCLRQDKKGYEQAEQYIKVISVSSEERTFYAGEKTFAKTVVKMEISQPLEHSFVGVEYPVQGHTDAPCKIRETHVADAGQYYGVKPIVKAIKANMMTVQVPSLMEKLVPTTQSETLLSDLSASGVSAVLFDGSSESLTLSINSTQNSLYTGSPILPNTLVISTNGDNITDVDGTLMQSGQAVGVVDYTAGLISLNSMYVRVVSFTPASVADVVSDTAKILVSENTQSYNYIVNLPTPSTVMVQYRSQGKWYKLTQGEQTHGSISLNPQTGTLSITCRELPDIGSAIVIYWGSSATFIKRANLVPVVKSVISLPTTPDPSSITLSWAGGRATVNAQGVISGDVTGQYRDGVLLLDKAISGVTVGYNTGDKVSQNHPTPVRDLQGKINLTVGDFVAGSLVITYPLTVEGYDEIALGAVITATGRKGGNTTSTGGGSHGTHGAGTLFATLYDDGKGNLVDNTGKQFGTVAGGVATFNPDTTVSIPKARYQKTKIGEQVHSQTATKFVGLEVSWGAKTYQDIYRTSFAGFDYVPAGATLASNAVITASFYDTHPASAKSESVAVGTSLVFTVGAGELIVPNSLRFTMNGKSYFDKDGGIYTSLNTATGGADKVGSIDYSTGELILSDPIGAVMVQSLTTSVNAPRTDGISFITPSAPIRPASLTISATTLDGKKISATANAKGEFEGEYISGLVDVEYGLASVKFGKWVAVAGNEGEDWYNADAVVDGKIFKPTHVFSSSITYSTVAYSYLPVDSTTIRIDTVRLPQDGRVPIFRRGDTILITNSLKQALGSAHQAGQTIQLDRTDLDRLCITDSTGKAVNAELWDYDLEAGSITWTSPLDLSDYALPLFATCTWEEKNRIHGVDIDGTLTLIFPIKRDYPLEDTYVASVLIGGNLQVRASVPFTQRNWTNIWQDTRIGDEPLNRLNVKDYPIVLTDDGAIDEKWLIKFTSSSQFELYGQTLGFVLKTDTLQDLAPINPATKKPYFTIPREAFGADTPWSVQEVVRFNTWGTLMPVWVICAVQPSADNPKGSDGYTQVLFGDTTEV
ncbi:hypothetical protein [Moraxella equi]|uniref:Uncharacterized protein n=2 Tax=Moraxella equi TaxID=60442 RepID=A0A378QMB6_9GAMM|nr:hypothetical protein [Moraxella equi]OPH38419.1 hypothetical protein B5J93_06220 [Moraxella equi]STZ02039.1 Uncharacterised protein [Moraxella equi]STZ03658.1 Uncharacterised protein [Moraxella equi]